FGGGMKRGFLYGETARERPLLVTKNPITIPDLHATILAAMGIAPRTAFPQGNDITAARFAYDRKLGAMRGDVTFAEPANRSASETLTLTFGDARSGECRAGVDLSTGFDGRHGTYLVGIQPSMMSDGIAVWSPDRRHVSLWTSSSEIPRYGPTCGYAHIDAGRAGAFAELERTPSVTFGPVASPRAPRAPTAIPGISQRATLE